jgi:hypothetical protein
MPDCQGRPPKNHPDVMQPTQTQLSPGYRLIHTHIMLSRVAFSRAAALLVRSKPIPVSRPLGTLSRPRFAATTLQIRAASHVNNFNRWLSTKSAADEAIEEITELYSTARDEVSLIQRRTPNRKLTQCPVRDGHGRDREQDNLRRSRPRSCKGRVGKSSGSIQEHCRRCRQRSSRRGQEKNWSEDPRARGWCKEYGGHSHESGLDLERHKYKNDMRTCTMSLLWWHI